MLNNEVIYFYYIINGESIFTFLGSKLLTYYSLYSTIMTLINILVITVSVNNNCTISDS